MDKNEAVKTSNVVSPKIVPAPEGFIEPHSALLRQPVHGQRLYKVMRAEYLIDSISNSYLHFNRVDSYRDFKTADLLDGAQLLADRADNEATAFEKVPTFTAGDYYDQSRSRTYACCFSLESDQHIWQHYGSGGDHGGVAVVFDFAWLRQHLNAQLARGAGQLMLGDVPLRQIFSINYGIVDYVDIEQHRLNIEQLPNPILYTYLKAERFRVEHELRVSLSAIGMGKLCLGGEDIELPPSLHMEFDFRAAMAEGGILSIDTAPDCDHVWVEAELKKLAISQA